MQFTSMILSNVEISPGYWRIRLTAPQEFASATPGQFVMVRIGGGIDPLLRRHQIYEFINFSTQEPPTALQMTQQTVRLVLRDHADSANARVNAIGHGKIDNPILAAKIDCGFCPIISKLEQSTSATTGKHQGNGLAGQLKSTPL